MNEKIELIQNMKKFEDSISKKVVLIKSDESFDYETSNEKSENWTDVEDDFYVFDSSDQWRYRDLDRIQRSRYKMEDYYEELDRKKYEE